MSDDAHLQQFHRERKRGERYFDPDSCTLTFQELKLFKILVRNLQKILNAIMHTFRYSVLRTIRLHTPCYDHDRKLWRVSRKNTPVEQQQKESGEEERTKQ